MPVRKTSPNLGVGCVTASLLSAVFVLSCDRAPSEPREAPQPAGPPATMAVDRTEETEKAPQAAPAGGGSASPPPGVARSESSPEDPAAAGAGSAVLDAQPDRMPTSEGSTGSTSSAPAGSLPRAQYAGLTPRARRLIQAAYTAADQSPDNAEAVGKLGMIYLQVAAPVEAIACLERAAGLEPQAMRWRYYLALGYEAIYDMSRAVAALREAIQLDETYAPLHAKLGDLLFPSDPAAAAECYLKAAGLNPRDARACFGLGRCAEAAGKPAEAIAWFEKTIRLAPQAAAPNAALAELLEKAGRTAEASVCRARAGRGGPLPIAGDPLYVDLVNVTNTSAVLLRQADELVDQGKLENAIALLETASQRGEVDPSIRNMLGVLLGKQGRYEDGIRQFRMVLETEPHRLEARSNLAFALQRMGRYSQAEEIFQGILEEVPNDPTTLRLYAALLLEVGRPRDALPHLRELLPLEPDDAATRLELATALVCAGEFDAAISHYQEYLQSASRPSESSSPLVTRLVQVLSDQRAFEQPTGRRAGFLQLSDLSRLAGVLRARGLPQDEAAAASAAELLVIEASGWAENGQFDRAVRILESGVASDATGNLDAALGALYISQHRFTDAAVHLRSALKKDETLIMARSNLGQVLVEFEQFEEAERHFREVLKRQPDHRVTLRRLGLLLGRTDRAEEGLALLKRCEKLAPGEPVTEYCIADLMVMQGRSSEALELVRRTHTNRSDDADSRLAMGNLLYRLGDAAGAEKEWREAIRLRPAFVSGYLAIEEAALRRKDYAAARSALREGLRHARDSALLQNNLAHLLATCPQSEIRDPQEAIRLASRACHATRDSNFQLLDTLAICQAALGNFHEAAQTQARAIALAERSGATGKAAEFQKRLALFKARQAYSVDD